MRAFATALTIVTVFGVTSASAAGALPGCTVVTDAAGDVAVSGTPQSSGHVPDAHLDLRAASVATDARTMTVRIDLTDISDTREGVWRLTFITRGKRAFVTAGNGGVWLNAGDSSTTDGFFAGLAGGRAVEVKGLIDYGADAITVTVPLSAFGPAAPRRGDALTGFALAASETFAHVAPFGLGGADVTLVDEASSAARYVTGARC